MEAPPGGVDDMTKLSYLHEPGVLQNLSTRYQLNEIYVRRYLTSVNCFLYCYFHFGERKPLTTAAMGGCVIILYRILTYDRHILAIS